MVKLSEMGDFLRCKNCKHDKGKCVGSSRKGGHKNCFEPKIATNADRIRTMSDEELCNFIMDAPAIPCDEKISAMMKDNGCNNCEKCVMDWLQQPAEK